MVARAVRKQWIFLGEIRPAGDDGGPGGRLAGRHRPHGRRPPEAEEERILLTSPSSAHRRSAAQTVHLREADFSLSLSESS